MIAWLCLTTTLTVYDQADPICPGATVLDDLEMAWGRLMCASTDAWFAQLGKYLPHFTSLLAIDDYNFPSSLCEAGSFACSPLPSFALLHSPILFSSLLFYLRHPTTSPQPTHKRAE